MPKLDKSDVIMMRDVKFVLVVEKEASFRSLSSGLSYMLASEGIMVTVSTTTAPHMPKTERT